MRVRGDFTAPRRSLASVRRRMAGCRICSGDLELKVQGEGVAVTAAALSPSAHAVGGHGDLLACVECGTVQQPILPKGAELHDLYRDMRDDDYLSEEPGRRATANRLLDLIGAHVPEGRLLDVGCGHGLLLDEARGRGYETVGLELSPRGGAPCALAGPRRARAAAGSLQRELQRRLAGRVRRDRARRRPRAPRRPGRRDRPLRPPAAPRRGAVRGHAGPVEPDRQARRRALVGLSARPHRAAAAPDAARADLRPRAGDLRRHPVRAHVRGAALGGWAGRAARAAQRAADERSPTACRR